MHAPGALGVAFIGLGAIGRETLHLLDIYADSVRVLGALVAQAQRSRPCHAFASFDELLAAAPDLVIECARQPVLAAFGPRVLRAGVNVVAASVGALADEETLRTLTEAAEAGGARLFVPAGALSGIDALAAAKHVGLSGVRYIRRAPPATWVKSGSMKEADALALTSPRAVFDGTAREASRRYPKNANVTATVALAGIGFERTRVTLLADPDATSNVHIIEAEGRFGRLRTEISAVPMSGSTSSAIVAGSLARAVLSRTERIAV